MKKSNAHVKYMAIVLLGGGLLGLTIFSVVPYWSGNADIHEGLYKRCPNKDNYTISNYILNDTGIRWRYSRRMEIYHYISTEDCTDNNLSAVRMMIILGIICGIAGLVYGVCSISYPPHGFGDYFLVAAYLLTTIFCTAGLVHYAFVYAHDKTLLWGYYISCGCFLNYLVGALLVLVFNFYPKRNTMLTSGKIKIIEEAVFLQQNNCQI